MQVMFAYRDKFNKFAAITRLTCIQWILVCLIATSRQLCLPLVRSFTQNVSRVSNATDQSAVAFSI